MANQDYLAFSLSQRLKLRVNPHNQRLRYPSGYTSRLEIEVQQFFEASRFHNPQIITSDTSYIGGSFDNLHSILYRG
jgi:hypothetical protein